MNANAMVTYLLELNVLNVEDIKRQLHQAAAHSRHPQVKKWLMTTVFRFVVNAEDASEEYTEYTKKRPKQGIHTDLPDPEKLPDWAKKALETKTKFHFFNRTLARQRKMWQTVNDVVDWFNSLPATDVYVMRVDRMSFVQAAEKATKWKDEIKKSPWQYIKDRPPVVKDFGDGFKFVQLKTAFHHQREGYRDAGDQVPATSLGHCIGNACYIANNKAGTHQYYSLRDAENRPYATLEVERNRNVLQIKGKRNQAPVPEAIPYILKFIEERGWNITGDRSFVGL